MSSKKKILAIIPARGGSKGILRKNIKLLADKPLIAHTIEQTIGATYVSRIIVSTDDEEIASISRKYKVEVVNRPAELATDTATSESVVKHVLDYLRQTEKYVPDLIVVLQCTSPVRTPDDIDCAVKMIIEEGADSLVSVVRWHGFVWRSSYGEAQSINFEYRNRPRRQDAPIEFRENGSIFVLKPWVIMQLDCRLGGKIVLFEMSSWTQFETDTLEDFAICEWILENKIYLKLNTETRSGR